MKFKARICSDLEFSIFEKFESDRILNVSNFLDNLIRMLGKNSGGWRNLQEQVGKWWISKLENLRKILCGKSLKLTKFSHVPAANAFLIKSFFDRDFHYHDDTIVNIMNVVGKQNFVQYIIILNMIWNFSVWIVDW